MVIGPLSSTRDAENHSHNERLWNDRFWREAALAELATLALCEEQNYTPCLEASTLPMEKRPGFDAGVVINGYLGDDDTRRAVGGIVAGILLLTFPVMAAEPPAELISGFRLKSMARSVSRATQPF